MALTGLSGQFSYTYDSAGRETGLTNPYGQQAAWAYLNNDWLQTQTLGNGATTSYTYDARGQVTDLKNVSGGSTVSEFTMSAPGGYDGAGNRTGMTTTGAFPGGVSYAYDGRDELLTETSTRTGASYTDAQHYDGVTGGTTTGPGNLTTLRGTSHTYNADNQVTANTYDGDGNPITYHGTACKYDPEGRQTADGTAQSNTYTGDGLRALKHWTYYTYYFYDGDQVLAESDQNSTINALHTVGPNGQVSLRNSGSDLYYAWDPSGNVAQGLKGSGSVSASYAVDGFGRGGGGNPPEGLGGQWGSYYDAQDGLTLMGHRDYDANAGRFLTRDPMGYGGGVDLYGYTQNDPVNEDDPSGFSPSACPVAKKPHPRKPVFPRPQPDGPPFQCGKEIDINIKAEGGPGGVGVGIDGTIHFDVADYWSHMPPADKVKIHTCADLYEYMLKHLIVNVH